jgi:hypothetical protein
MFLKNLIFPTRIILKWMNDVKGKKMLSPAPIIPDFSQLCSIAGLP